MLNRDLRKLQRLRVGVRVAFALLFSAFWSSRTSSCLPSWTRSVSEWMNEWVTKLARQFQYVTAYVFFSYLCSLLFKSITNIFFLSWLLLLCFCCCCCWSVFGVMCQECANSTSRGSAGSAQIALHVAERWTARIELRYVFPYVSGSSFWW